MTYYIKNLSYIYKAPICYKYLQREVFVFIIAT